MSTKPYDQGYHRNFKRHELEVELRNEESSKGFAYDQNRFKKRKAMTDIPKQYRKNHTLSGKPISPPRKSTKAKPRPFTLPDTRPDLVLADSNGLVIKNARVINGQYGPCWVILNEDDTLKEFLPFDEKKLAAKGYTSNEK